MDDVLEAVVDELATAADLDGCRFAGALKEPLLEKAISFVLRAASLLLGLVGLLEELGLSQLLLCLLEGLVVRLRGLAVCADGVDVHGVAFGFAFVAGVVHGEEVLWVLGVGVAVGEGGVGGA
jgi:hypothetical protein